jgi:hypothetical protein
MYVRVLNFVCRQEIEREQVQRFYRLMIEHAQDIDGFIGGTLLMQEAACDGMALMYWTDKEAASTAGPVLLEILGQHIHDLLDTPPDIRGFDVVETGIKLEDL